MNVSESTVDLQARPGILPNPVAHMTVCGQEVVLSSSDVSDRESFESTRQRLGSPACCGTTSPKNVIMQLQVVEQDFRPVVWLET